MNIVVYDVTVAGGDNASAREDAAQIIAQRRGISFTDALGLVDEEVNRAVAQPLALTIEVTDSGKVRAAVGVRWPRALVRHAGDGDRTALEIMVEREGK